MHNRLTYSLFAWVTLVALCGMMVIKDYHALWMHVETCSHSACCHYHVHRAQDVICVLDGIPLSEHKGHSHASFVETDSDEDDCAICHFAIAKILRPTYLMYGLTATCLGTLSAHDYLLSLYTFLNYCPGRAPPFFN